MSKSYDSWGTVTKRFPPREKIIRTDLYLVLFLDREGPASGWEKIVDLACGHKMIVPMAATRARQCLRCCEIVRQGLDWDGFRHLGHRDPLDLVDGLNQLEPKS